MSSTLTWEPTERPKGELSDELKQILRKAYNDGQPIHNMILAERHIDYLVGLDDGGIKDAGKLVAAIQKYKEIVLNEES